MGPNDANSPFHEFRGYLVDCIWGEMGKDDKGRDLADKPSLITAKHLRSEASGEAGYGLFMQTSGQKARFVRFNETGNLMTKELLGSKDIKKKKNFVTVKGFLNNDGTLTVMEIALSSQHTDQPRQPGPPDQGSDPQGGMPPQRF
jgi:hypothetical protein